MNLSNGKFTKKYSKGNKDTVFSNKTKHRFNIQWKIVDRNVARMVTKSSSLEHITLKAQVECPGVGRSRLKFFIYMSNIVFIPLNSNWFNCLFLYVASWHAALYDSTICMNKFHANIYENHYVACILFAPPKSSNESLLRVKYMTVVLIVFLIIIK